MCKNGRAFRNRYKTNRVSRQNSNIRLNEILDRELISEIQFNAPLLNTQNILRTIRNEELDKSMEIIENIIPSEKVIKMVKFKEESDWKEKFKTSNLQKYLTSKLVRKGTKTRNTGKKSRNSHTSNKFRTFGGSRRSKKSTKQQRDSSNVTETSRPGSVTSLYTACSYGNQTYSQKFSNNFVQTSKIDFQTQKDISEREIIESIEDLYISDQKRDPRVTTKQRGHIKKLSLISEIQSENDYSKDISMESQTLTENSHPSPVPKKETQKVANYVPVSFKTTKFIKNSPNSKASTKKAKSSTKEFRCFEESDVIEYINFTPIKNIYSLTRGDDDEDSDGEDVFTGEKFMIHHLEKALHSYLKR